MGIGRDRQKGNREALSASNHELFVGAPLGQPGADLATPAKGELGYSVVKRAVDVAIAIPVLLLSLPMIGILALIIKLDSKGPAIFRQTRLGKDGKPFQFYKFRTMLTDARERYPELYSYQYESREIEEMYFKLPWDPRLSRFGRHLRRTSLDELPNLINVVLGDMSLVGPRPEIPEMLPYYRPEQLAKFRVKPGLTGMAQVNGRNILRFQETITYDLEYVRRRSVGFDLRILLRTPLVVIRMLGAL